MANLTALRAVVFSLSAKNLRGADNHPPAVRGLIPMSDNEFGACYDIAFCSELLIALMSCFIET